MAIAFTEMAARALRWGDESPFDASQEWHEKNWDADPKVNPPPPQDWAHRAARGIVAELSDDHGAWLEQAFHLERVGEDDRRAIIETMAAIIRRAASESESAREEK